MTSLRRYAQYYVKSTLLRLLILLAVCLLLMYSFMEVRLILDAEGNPDFVKCDLRVLGVAIGIAATVMPVLELSCFKNRRNLDMLYFLPVSRMKMAVAHYLNGLFQLVVVGVVCFGAAALWLLPYHAYVSLGALFLYFCFAMLCALLIYSFFMFVFMQAETVWDGVVLMLVYALLAMILLMAGSATEHVFDILPDDFSVEYAFIYSPLGMAGKIFDAALHQKTPSPLGEEGVLSIALWSFVGVLAIAGYFITFPRHRAEKVGGISDSFFGYRVLIPLCGFCLIYWNGGYMGFYGLILILMLVGYILYRRGLALKRSDLIMLALSFVLNLFRAAG